MEEGKGVALAILGIVAVIAVVGLVLLFSGATGKGIYGGALTRTPGVDLYQVGEEPPRYTSPVPISEGGTYYSHRPGWVDLQRDTCSDPAYGVVTTPAQVGARTDCYPSDINAPYMCCPATGQAGHLATGE